MAVVGAGVAGLSAAYALARAGVAVELFEADGRLGGHAHTQRVTAADGRELALDTGFLVHNTRTYPELVGLFGELGVRTQDSDMSMSVHCEGCGLEYAGARGLSGLLATPGNLARGRYLRMLGEVPRFHRLARRLLATPEDETADETAGGAEHGAEGGSESLRAFLARHDFSPYFTQHFMTPLVSAVWSCAPDLAGDYPARYLFAFLANHGLLSVTGSPTWRTVVGGSAAYVERIASHLAAHSGTVHRSAPVRAVRRHPDGVTVATEDGRWTRADAVVVAVHADQALRLLADPTGAEREVLGAFEYSRNPTVLHRDASVLPRAAWARASWNYRMPDCDAPSDRVRVSYHLNRLLRLGGAEDYLVTLNEDDRSPLPERQVVTRTVYEHPVYTARTVAAQRRLPELTTARTAFAGAYHGWGFHEDGCRSGLAAARHLLTAVAP
ncbi:FAD-dependent oxidoreductase [Kitasatospora sp. YST-16]|uniref:NAD(P)/FAD-dependent oxidoreductase n=1 Tax=Kitasatospora sp. YST-16 TaxID=2998080 RepID=UPI002284210A|nr:FAD-dependent oxidoreductase [Kitasatospora sp. YST-16]WAL70083.1 FAD-dependent oxidoreductase [Kitasatospora sp. YST-16]WAL76126.1 FAD-dependent oxidoreductase [Kitasatospora sp. YST-16]WNW36122.1 FAD-dependent oxidoreductase [Streptomyces sp. Li-HN-5-13]WNW42181.1 FAD-dependent oxidoreductase [Streptomyces sp. Li-HN-5-13]